MRISAQPPRIIVAVLEALLMRKPIEKTYPDHGECPDDYIVDDLPPAGMRVEVVGYVGGTRHVIPFLCCWTDEGWVVAGTRRKLAFNVAGWRRVGV